MIVYLNADGTIQQVVPQTLTQGSNNQNLIVVGANISNYTSLSAIFKLPSGQILTPILMTKQDSDYVINNEIVNVWICQITKSITNFSGLLELTIKARTNNIDVNSYMGTVQIAPTNAPIFPSIDETSEEIFNQIADAYSYISGRLLSKQDIYDNNLDTEDKTVVGAINELVQKIAEFDAGQVSIEEFEELQHTVSDLIQDVARALKTPIVRPTETKLVAVDDTNSQTMVDLGEDFKVENDTLKLTGANISNPNLLINGDFVVNQRGQEVYDTEGFCVDRWYFKGVTHDTLQTNFNAKTKTFTMKNISAYNLPSFGLFQYIENSNELLGKTVTLSVKLNGNLYSVTGNIEENYSENDQITSIKLESDEDLNYVSRLSLYWNNTLKMLQFQIRVHVKPGYEYSMQLSEAKLEIGTVATAFSPRPYAEELAMCQRYYIKTPSNTIFAGRGNSTNVCTFMIPLPVTQRSAGSINISDLIVSAGNTSYTTNTLHIQSMENTSVGKNVMIETDLTTLAFRTAYNMYSTAWIELDAEIY